MLLFEHDAKELLAVQGIPVAGGIRLEQIPATTDTTPERSGPWLVKPQVPGGLPNLDDHVVAATNNAEIAAAAARLLGSTIAGQTIHTIWVERQFASRGQTALRLVCDLDQAGIRIAVGSASPGAGTLVPPDPGAVIEGVKRLAAALPDGARECVAEAGRMLTPLFFGYEATLMEVDPLFLLADDSWIVGNVRLALDEQSLFRHPELITLVERRVHAYGDVRLRRRRGMAHHVIDDAGAVAVLANGKGLGALIVDELRARNVPVHSSTTADAVAYASDTDNLDYFLDWIADTSGIRCLLIAVSGDAVDLADCAKALAQALAKRTDETPSVVVRLLGSGAGTAGAVLQQAHPAVHLEPMLETAFDHVAERVADAAG